MPYNDDVGHMMENDHYLATVHAEANAIIQAARNGNRVNGADIYVTASPCWNCFKLINSGIKRTLHRFYRDEKILTVAPEPSELIRSIVNLSSFVSSINFHFTSSV